MNTNTFTLRTVGIALLVAGTVLWIVSFGLISTDCYHVDLATTCGYWTMVVLLGGICWGVSRLTRGTSPSAGDPHHLESWPSQFERDEPRPAGIFRRPISRRWQVVLGIVSILNLATVYTIASYVQHRRNPTDRSLPTWSQLYHDGLVRSLTDGADNSEDVREYPTHDRGFNGVVRRLMEPFLTDRYDVWLWADFKATFGRLASGLVLGTLVSLVVGLLMGCYPVVASYFLPPMFFLSKIPATAIMAIFFFFFGAGFRMYVMMIAFGVIPTLTQAIYHSAKEDVPEELISKAHTLGASQIECIWDVIYRHVLPKILEFVRLQVGPAMVYLIAAEMLVGQVGFGYRIKIEWRISDMSIVYVYCIYLGIAGSLLDSALIRLQQTICPWYAK